MNEEELNEIESLDIVLNDVDDLDMGLEVISYKARKTIQELANIVMEQSGQLQAYKDKEKNIDDYIKELLEVNKDINKQLQTYKDKEDKIRELIEAPIDNMSLNWQSKLILAILNEGDK